MEAPEKIYVSENPITNEPDERWQHNRCNGTDIEYIRIDVFIEKALKWYCLDCECNDNCDDTKCFFYHEYEHYLKGDTNVIPPKLSDRILNEDGSISDDWHYRHFIKKMQDVFIEKTCIFLKDRIAHDSIDYPMATNALIEDFKNYMKGE